MSIKSWFEDKLKGIVVNRVTKKIVSWLDGKKTTIGAINLLLWVAIFAIPAFTPQYNFITLYATQIRDLLIDSGFNIDNELFNTGVGFTILGLVDKIRKLIKGE